MFRATKANKSKEAKKKEAAAPKRGAKQASKRSSILADSSDDELQVFWIQQLLFNTNSVKFKFVMIQILWKLKKD